jgi:hypothetical protein
VKTTKIQCKAGQPYTERANARQPYTFRDFKNALLLFLR